MLPPVAMDRRSWDERYEAAERAFPPHPNALIAAEIDGLAPGRALDLACGQGRHASWLAARGWRPVAVDFSVVGVTRARRGALDQGLDVAWLVADVHTLAVPPSWFDLVVMAFFHPRPSERDLLYATVASTLRPGGTFVQVSYDLANLAEGSSGPRDPEVLVEPADVARRLEGAGLVVRRADTVRLRVPTPDGGEVDVVDAIVRAERPHPPSG